MDVSRQRAMYSSPDAQSDGGKISLQQASSSMTTDGQDAARTPGSMVSGIQFYQLFEEEVLPHGQVPSGQVPSTPQLQLLSSARLNRQDSRTVMVGRQFQQLFEDDSMSATSVRHHQADHGQPQAASMMERLQELLGVDHSPPRPGKPVPLAQQVVSLVSAEDFVPVAEERRHVMGRLDGDTDEVLDADSERNSEVEDIPVATGLSMVVQPPSMMQQFQNALLASPTIREDFFAEHTRVPVLGFSAQLQRVIHKEKDQRATFSKSKASLQDSSRCLTVQIMNRCLEARLSTCYCRVLDAPENWSVHGLHSTAETGHGCVNVIFNSKVNSDLDLEVGRVVRIYHPWQEITSTERFRKIVVCTYFAEMVGVGD